MVVVGGVVVVVVGWMVVVVVVAVVVVVVVGCGGGGRRRRLPACPLREVVNVDRQAKAAVGVDLQVGGGSQTGATATRTGLSHPLVGVV